jgi:hypothetical protein
MGGAPVGLSLHWCLTGSAATRVKKGKAIACELSLAEHIYTPAGVAEHIYTPAACWCGDRKGNVPADGIGISPTALLLG